MKSGPCCHGKEALSMSLTMCITHAEPRKNHVTQQRLCLSGVKQPTSNAALHSRPAQPVGTSALRGANKRVMPTQGISRRAAAK